MVYRVPLEHPLHCRKCWFVIWQSKRSRWRNCHQQIAEGPQSINVYLTHTHTHTRVFVYVWVRDWINIDFSSNSSLSSMRFHTHSHTNPDAAAAVSNVAGACFGVLTVRLILLQSNWEKHCECAKKFKARRKSCALFSNQLATSNEQWQCNLQWVLGWWLKSLVPPVAHPFNVSPCKFHRRCTTCKFLVAGIYCIGGGEWWPFGSITTRPQNILKNAHIFLLIFFAFFGAFVEHVNEVADLINSQWMWMCGGLSEHHSSISLYRHKFRVCVCAFFTNQE